MKHVKNYQDLIIFFINDDLASVNIITELSETFLFEFKSLSKNSQNKTVLQCCHDSLIHNPVLHLFPDDLLNTTCTLGVLREWHPMGNNCRFQGNYRFVVLQSKLDLFRNVNHFSFPKNTGKIS